MRVGFVLLLYLPAVYIAWQVGEAGWAVLIAVGLATGFVSGRWEALALALLVPVVASIGDADDTGAGWLVALVFVSPVVAAATAVGVGIRRRLARSPNQPRSFSD